MGENKKYNSPRNVAYHFQHLHSLVRFFAPLGRNCNDNDILSRGSAETDLFSPHPRNTDKTLGRLFESQGRRALHRARLKRQNILQSQRAALMRANAARV
jgi:hypothetical protein